jgi:hypothetical protein
VDPDPEKVATRLLSIKRCCVPVVRFASFGESHLYSENVAVIGFLYFAVVIVVSGCRILLLLAKVLAYILRLLRC